MTRETPDPWQVPWPADMLEHLGECPVCGSIEREVLEAALIDDTFHTAQGEWTLWKCDACHGAYLDPRPDEASIGRAYESYYTHSAGAADGLAPWNRFSGLSRYLAAGYVNARFGSQLKPAFPFGGFLRFLRRKSALGVEGELRNLPALPKAGASVLDVGCGSGSFLAVARQLGWMVHGIDPDPQARASADALGLPVTDDTLAELAEKGRQYDVITLSHVIEHVHRPVDTLRQCHALLKPGGRIWLETPNIGSRGYRRFGRYWRGIEAPRHLVLFTRQSLAGALEAAGFVEIRDEYMSNVAPGMFAESRALEEGLPRTPERLRELMTGFADLKPGLADEGEFIRLSASAGLDG